MLQVSLTDRSDQLSPQAGVSIRPTNLPAPTAYPPDAVSRRLPHTRTVPRLLHCHLTPLSSSDCLLPPLLLPPNLLPPTLVRTTATIFSPSPRCCRRHDRHTRFSSNTHILAISSMRRSSASRATTLASQHTQHKLTYNTTTPNLW